MLTMDDMDRMDFLSTHLSVPSISSMLLRTLVGGDRIAAGLGAPG